MSRLYGLDLAFEAYLTELTLKLGPHYKIYNYRNDTWYGFIYCECYGGERFSDMDTSNNISERPLFGIGAIARIEDRHIVLLDHRLGYAPDRRATSDQPHSSDGAIIDVAHPDFDKQFSDIKTLHDEILEYFNKEAVCGTKP